MLMGKLLTKTLQLRGEGEVESHASYLVFAEGFTFKASTVAFFDSAIMCVLCCPSQTELAFQGVSILSKPLLCLQV